MNNVKVFTLLAGMTAVMGMVGQAMGGQSGMLIALLIAGVMNFYMYFTSSTKVMKAYKAQTITREQAPELYDIVDKLRQRAGLPMPTVGIAPQQQPNAFATGRNADHAVVCVTQGLLDMMDQDELEGVGKAINCGSGVLAAKNLPQNRTQLHDQSRRGRRSHRQNQGRTEADSRRGRRSHRQD